MMVSDGGSKLVLPVSKPVPPISKPVPPVAAGAADSGLLGDAGASRPLGTGSVSSPADAGAIEPSPTPTPPTGADSTSASSFGLNVDDATWRVEGQGWASDCDGEMYVYDAGAVGSAALRIIGWYEPTLDNRVYPPTGEGVIYLFQPGPVVLVLTAYEKTHWTVHVAAGARLERVLLGGYGEHTATVPAGVPVENHSGVDEVLPFAFEWPGGTGGGDTPGLVAAAERMTGLPLTSFHGCYTMNRVSFTDPAEPGIDCRVPEVPEDDPTDESYRGCSGSLLAFGSMFDRDDAATAEASCEAHLIAGATCCAFHLEGQGFWFLTDGEPVAEGGTPDDSFRSAGACRRVE